MVAESKDEGATMKDIIEILDENLKYIEHQIDGDYIEVIVESRRDEVSCPDCRTLSSRIHSTYSRSFQDLPIQGKKVYIKIDNRKYFCDEQNCSNTTFAESFDCVKPKAKKSERLKNEIIKISVEISSNAASKILSEGVVDISKSTICDMLKKNNENDRQSKHQENLHR